MAVGLETVDSDKRLHAWMTVWEVSSRKLLGRAEIPGTLDSFIRFIAVEHNTIRYTPDGSQIIFQAGDGYYVFDAAPLSIRYSLVYPLRGHAASRAHSRDFALSSDGSRLALFLGQNLLASTPGEVRIVDLGTGKEVSQWTAPSLIQSLSLSPDGKELLIGLLNPRDTKDLQILDCATGHVLRSYETGFATHRSIGARLNGIFLDSTHFLVSPGGGFEKRAERLTKVLEVFEKTQEVAIAKLSSDKFEPSGDVWPGLSTDVAALNVATSKWKNPLTEGPSAAGEIIFFRTNQSPPICHVGPLPKPNRGGSQTGFIRFSPDLRRLGLYFENQISVYIVPTCE